VSVAVAAAAAVAFAVAAGLHGPHDIGGLLLALLLLLQLGAAVALERLPRSLFSCCRCCSPCCSCFCTCFSRARLLLLLRLRTLGGRALAIALLRHHPLGRDWSVWVKESGASGEERVKVSSDRVAVYARAHGPPCVETRACECICERRLGM